MNILHISDLHFGTMANAKNWFSQLADDLIHELECKNVDILIISGDIANKSILEEYEFAKQFLNSFCQEFQVSSNQIVIVPGNHDLNWSLSKQAYKPKRREEYKGPMDKEGNPDRNYIIDNGNFVEIQNHKKYEQRFNYFSSFYETVIGKPYPLNYEEQAILYHFPKWNLLILGLNSAWQIDHHYISRANINYDALSNALNKIRNNPAIYDQCLKLAVWHHPINSSENDRITDNSFMQRLALSGFSIALHGHIHKTENELYRYDRSIYGRRIEIISAGTFGAPTRDWIPGYPLQYNLLKLEKNTISVETRHRREPDGAWKPDAIWTQGPGKDPLPRYKIDLPEIVDHGFELKAGEKTQEIGITKNLEDTVELREYQKELDVEIPVKKVLILAVCPKNTSRISMGEEVREICDVLRKSQKVKFIVEVRWAVRVRDLSRALLEFEPQIIHFIGHGIQGGLLIEDDIGSPHLLKREALSSLFKLFMDSVECVIECVFFNACYAEVQADAIAPYVNYIIGTGGRINDKTAVVFATNFYEALANGRSIEFAYKYAFNAVNLYDLKGDFDPIFRRAEKISQAMGKKSVPECKKSQESAIKILILAANPKDTPQLRLDEEMREIYEVLGYSIQNGMFVVQQRWGTRFEDLHQALLDFRPQVVHFTGCGTSEGLIFEDNIGFSHLVKIEPLIKLFELFSGHIECVVLNANFSENIAKEITRRIHFAIGIPEEYKERDAIAFSASFYRTLAVNKSYEEAYKAGCIEIEQQGNLEFLPKLYKKEQ
jgi:predicted phosphodiesterase